MFRICSTVDSGFKNQVFVASGWSFGEGQHQAISHLCDSKILAGKNRPSVSNPAVHNCLTCCSMSNFPMAHKLLRTEQNVDLYICMLHARLEFIDSFASRPSFGNPGGSFYFFESSSGLNRFNLFPRIQIFEVNWDA